MNWTNAEENELVEAARNGQVEAFSELVRRHQPACLKIAQTVLRNSEQAEDEVQNAFYKSFLRLHQFKQESSFFTWLTRIVLNQCLMHLRQARKRGLLSLDAGSENIRSPIQFMPCRSETPEQRLERKEQARWLQREIRFIPPALRSALLLRDVQQLSYILVAEKLGITVPAAKSRIRRARVELKSRLQRQTGLARLDQTT